MTKVNLGKDTSGRPLVLDDTTLAKIRWAEAQLGWTFTIIQGSYMAGIGASRSGGTHDAGGAVDLRTWDIPANIGIIRALTALREAGLIAWCRWQSAFPDHEIHALDYGDPNLSPSARNQVTAYLAGRNGLSGSLSGPDDGPKVTIPKTVPTTTDPTTPEVPMGMRPDFADLSHWNDGPFDFVKAKRAGLLLTILKATEGTSYVDPTFAALRRQVKAAGMLVGAYCFARPATLSKVADNAVTHARLFVATAGKDCDVYALDLETRGLLTTGRLTTWVREWVAEVRRLTGKPAGAVWVYTKYDLTDNADAPLWTARYSNSNAAPYVAKPWKAWTAWQYTNGVYGVPSSTPGVGHVDASQLNTTDPAGLLAALLADTPTPKPTPKPTIPTENDMTPAEMLTVLQSPEGQQAIRDAFLTGESIKVPDGVTGWSKPKVSVGAALQKILGATAGDSGKAPGA